MLFGRPQFKATKPSSNFLYSSVWLVRRQCGHLNLGKSFLEVCIRVRKMIGEEGEEDREFWTGSRFD